MVWRVGLLIVALIVVSNATPSAEAASGPCSVFDQINGICTSGNSDGTGVDVTATRSQDGDSADPGETSGGEAQTCDSFASCAPWLDVHIGGVDQGELGSNILFTQPNTGAAGVGAPAGRGVTISDVARFVPTDAVVHVEPDGWAVVGVPANAWVDVGVTTVDGRLLGADAAVRFTPIGYRWDYGDGTSSTTATGGASWAALGQRPLTPTSTGHTWTTRGEERVSASVLYRAEYRFGAATWTSVVGVVVAPERPVPVRVVTEGTVLSTQP